MLCFSYNNCSEKMSKFLVLSSNLSNINEAFLEIEFGMKLMSLQIWRF